MTHWKATPLSKNRPTHLHSGTTTQRRWLRALPRYFLLLVLTVPSIPATADRPIDRRVDEGIPPVLHSTTLDSAPVFVTADAAFDAEGRINSDLLDERSQSVLENLLEDPWSRGENGCIKVEEHWVERVNPPDRSSLQKAARTADLILEGTVIARDYGFSRLGLPGQLLKIQVEQVLSGTADLETYLVFFPVGTFKAGPYIFCKTDFRLPAAPSVGDRVFLLVPVVRNPSEPFLDLRDEFSLFVIDKEGEVRLPTRLVGADKRRPSRTEVLSEIRGALEGGPM